MTIQSFQASVACCIVLLTACAFDSRMLSEPRTQRATAAKLTPQFHESTTPTKADLQPLKVRVYVTRAHQVESPAWQDHWTERVAAANRVLASELGVRLEVEQPRAWPLAGPSDHLDRTLSALRALDPGADVDFVVGLIPSEAKLSGSFHELGYAELFGKHVILRAANSAQDLDAIEQSFDKLSASERQKLYRARRAHKAAAVFLHELAHALGAPHIRDATSIMSPHYRPKESGFGMDASRYLDVAFRFRMQEPRDDRSMARALLKELDRSRNAWVAAERDDLVARLTNFADAENHSNHAPKPVATSNGLPAPDRELFARAHTELSTGDAEAAWQTAKPLFERYPDEYEVQDLRCNISMRRGLPYDAVQTECKRLTQLAPGNQR